MDRIKTRRKKSQTLKIKVEKFLIAEQKKINAMWSKAEMPEYSNSNDFADCKLYTDLHGLLVLTYDGQGYDHFSYNAEYDLGTRSALEKLASKNGYYLEDNNCWSLVFVPNNY